MPSNLIQSVQNYETKLRLGAVGKRSDAQLGRQVSNYAFAAARQSVVQTQVRQTLDAAGVSTIQYVFYHNFSRELEKLSRTWEGSADSLAREALVLVVKWVRRGLCLAVLNHIRSQIFNIPDPLPPGA